MLKFNRQIDYAVQLMISLARLENNKYLSLKYFSSENNISFLFLQRIARDLKKAKLIDSKRGAFGGYYLTKNPSKISLLNILEAIEGSCGVTECLRKEGKCARKEVCKARAVFASVNKYVIKHLSDVKLSKFI